MKNIIVLHFKEYSRDPRLVKQVDTLLSNGANVLLITYLYYNYSRGSSKDNFQAKIYRKDQNVDEAFGGRTSTSLILFSFWAMKQLYKNRNSTYAIICNDLPTLPIGVFGKLVNWRIFLIYDSHELFPDLTSEFFGRTGFLVMLYVEKVLMLFRPLVITVSFNLLQILKKRYGIFQSYIIPNFPSLSAISNVQEYIPEEILPNIDRYEVKFIYSGTIMKGRGYRELIASCRTMNQHYGDNRYCLVIAGDGDMKDDIMELARDLPNVYFTGYVQRESLYGILRKMDYGLCIFSKQESLNNLIGLPNKILEYLVFSLPIVLTNLPSTMKYLKGTRYISLETLEIQSLTNALEKAIDTNEMITKRVNYDFTWEKHDRFLRVIAFNSLR